MTCKVHCEADRTFGPLLLLLCMFVAGLCVSCGCGDGDDDDSESDDDGLNPYDDDNDDDGTDDDTGDDDQWVFIDEDFEDNDVGVFSDPLWREWFKEGNSTYEIVDAGGGHSHVLQINGGKDAGDGVGLIYDWDGGVVDDLTLTFAVYLEENAYFIFELSQEDVSDFSLEIVPETGKLLASLKEPVGQGWTCGTLNWNKWQTIEITALYQGRTYSVFINGESTSCENLDLNAPTQLPWRGFIISEEIFSGYGGVARFDDFVGSLPYGDPGEI